MASLLTIRSGRQLLGGKGLDWYDWNEEGIAHILRVVGAFWRHSGDLSAPHARLTSGKCSNGYVNLSVAFSYAPLVDQLAKALSGKISRELRLMNKRADWIVGSDHKGAAISYAVARELKLRTDFTEKASGGRQQEWSRHDIGVGQKILLVDDLATTFFTTDKVIEGLCASPRVHRDAEILPLLAYVVNRSGRTVHRGRHVISLIAPDIQVWEREECPLCQAGSRAIEPTKNWETLTLSA